MHISNRHRAVRSAAVTHHRWWGSGCNASAGQLDDLRLCSACWEVWAADELQDAKLRCVERCIQALQGMSNSYMHAWSFPVSKTKGFARENKRQNMRDTLRKEPRHKEREADRREEIQTERVWLAWWFTAKFKSNNKTGVQKYFLKVKRVISVPPVVQKKTA